MNIAITGGIGAGKSTIINALKLEFPTSNFYSMDKFVDELYQEESWLKWLQERFHTTDRKELSNRAFACDSVRAALNTQSAMKIGVKLGFILADGVESLAINFVEFPLLFETGLEDKFDHTILITADTEVRVARVVGRGKKTAEEARAVINAQMPEAKKAQLADFVIDTTSGSVDDCTYELVKYLKGQK